MRKLILEALSSFVGPRLRAAFASLGRLRSRCLELLTGRDPGGRVSKTRRPLFARSILASRPYRYLRRAAFWSIGLFIALNLCLVAWAGANGNLKLLPHAWRVFYVEAPVQLFNCGPRSVVADVWTCR